MKDKKETFKDLKCSPSNDDNTEFSCYSANELNKIKEAWKKLLQMLMCG